MTLLQLFYILIKIYLQIALIFDPNFADAHYLAVRIACKTDKLDDALFELQRTIELRPDFFDARYLKAQVLARQNRIGEAIQELDDAVRNCPGSFNDNMTMGDSYMNFKMFDKAAERYQAAIALDRDDRRARESLAAALKRDEAFFDQLAWASGSKSKKSTSDSVEDPGDAFRSKAGEDGSSASNASSKTRPAASTFDPGDAFRPKTLQENAGDRIHN